MQNSIEIKEWKLYVACTLLPSVCNLISLHAFCEFRTFY